MDPAHSSPTSPTTNDAVHSQHNSGSHSNAHTVVPPALISPFESKFWYHGISGDPPHLMYRSDLSTNPFPLPIPAPGGRFFTLPTKTVRPVGSNSPLKALWHTVAPQILESIKANGIRYTALSTVRFSTCKEDEGEEEETLGPAVVWIAVRPGMTNALAVRDATPDIFRILASSQITDVVVEWYEGSVERL